MDAGDWRTAVCAISLPQFKLLLVTCAATQLVRMCSASNPHTLALVLHDLEDLLLLDKPPIQSAPKKKGTPASDAAEPYNRAKYYKYAADKNKAFRELYNFCFALAKPPYVPPSFVSLWPLITLFAERAGTLTWT